MKKRQRIHCAVQQDNILVGSGNEAVPFGSSTGGCGGGEQQHCCCCHWSCFLIAAQHVNGHDLLPVYSDSTRECALCCSIRCAGRPKWLLDLYIKTVMIRFYSNNVWAFAISHSFYCHRLFLAGVGKTLSSLVSTTLLFPLTVLLCF